MDNEYVPPVAVVTGFTGVRPGTMNRSRPGPGRYEEPGLWDPVEGADVRE